MFIFSALRLFVCLTFVIVIVEAYPKEAVKPGNKEAGLVTKKVNGQKITTATPKVTTKGSTAVPPRTTERTKMGATHIENDLEKGDGHDEENEDESGVQSGKNKLGESLYCPGVVCSFPSFGHDDVVLSCQETWTTSINPVLPVMGSKLDCCPVHICIRHDGSQFTHYGIERPVEQVNIKNNPQQLQDSENTKINHNEIPPATQTVAQQPFSETFLGIFPPSQKPQQELSPLVQYPMTGPFQPQPQPLLPPPPFMMLNMLGPQFPRFNRNVGPFFPVDGWGVGPWGPTDVSSFYNLRARRDADVLQQEQQWTPSVFYGEPVPMQAFPVSF
ncbi:uncharacterized protein LOC110843286 isoform X2 [Folsomia candida]|uniref:uncharacterized protein LOC110843286 isoform X2 n=1 Tax=Folsomia candida TaxID=158441 RepID=UPI001604B0FC|nr:uncharacterized protein LOC110843286 isoform X2 [Folsomia candida]